MTNAYKDAGVDVKKADTRIITYKVLT